MVAVKYIHSFLLSEAPDTTDSFPENQVVTVLYYRLVLDSVAHSRCKCNCLRTVGPMTVSHSKILILQQHATEPQYCCVLQLLNFAQCVTDVNPDLIFVTQSVVTLYQIPTDALIYYKVTTLLAFWHQSFTFKF